MATRQNRGSLCGDVYHAVAIQIGALVDSVSSDTTVMVFALHGMRPALGFPAFLGPLLCEQVLTGKLAFTIVDQARVISVCGN